tara:strand:- start:1724 stop:1924 length:201 start_codon:yes stop_codon:yes gene_type:complete
LFIFNKTSERKILVLLAINKTTATKPIDIWNLATLLLLAGICEFGTTAFSLLKKISFKKRPKNWFE